MRREASKGSGLFDVTIKQLAEAEPNRFANIETVL